MNTQNILKYYGSKIDIVLDKSDFNDYELNFDNDHDLQIIDYDKLITYSGLTIDSNCVTGTTLNDIKPWSFDINVTYSGYTCEHIVRNRTEIGWTLDFVFNRENVDIISGGTFYYLGIIGTIEDNLYVDNNLSFRFNDEGGITWEAYRYSGYCDNISGYTDQNYVSSGKTISLCDDDISNDFNVTVVFERYNQLSGCTLENDGGTNDLIIQVDENYSIYDWMTGATENVYVYELNKKWSDERNLRLGVLRIYINGRPIYKIENWEEVIPSKRSSNFQIIQSWGGLNDSVNPKNGVTPFNLKQIKYFEEPLKPLNVKHHYITEIKPNFNITECGDSLNCSDDLYAFV